jgi:ABC-type sugar transport system ATPase subunit
MRTLSVAGVQTVEIARAIGADAAAVIMDEPTAAISEREVQALFRSIRALKARGTAIVYITHKMMKCFASPTASRCCATVNGCVLTAPTASARPD